MQIIDDTECNTIEGSCIEDCQLRFLLVDGACTTDIKKCLDGNGYVTRNPGNNCKFDLCPEEKNVLIEVCEGDIKECEDGSVVTRNPIDNCEFRAFPSVSKTEILKCDPIDKNSNLKIDLTETEV
ncbi:MAG: hypothetical protein Q9M91_00260 [Candidatus Dojkabacteria bacterium]|nr:hypothetical protein [Candidatus Dojkabacteria bacterium]MDQ7020265.1 hypothetical protein [Candidatus Dojkabacteria bacterium]